MEKNKKQDGFRLRPRALVADCDGESLTVFSRLLEGLGFETLTARTGLEALEKLPGFRPDIVVLDAGLPGLAAMEAARRIKEDAIGAQTPVLVAAGSPGDMREALWRDGWADEIIYKPINEAEFGLRVRNMLKVKRYEEFLVQSDRLPDGEICVRRAELERAFDKIREGYVETVYRLTKAAEYRDRETGSHIRRISLYSQTLSRYLGLSETDSELIFFASPMHDVGKIGIPDSVLLKKGPHDEDERKIMMSHTVIGADILKGSDSEILETARVIALTHHERWDGSGYPEGISGEGIPLPGRIVQIADVYDALRSRRPYKDPMVHKKTCRIMDRMEGFFDPGIYAAFKECSGEFARLFDENCPYPADQ